MGDLKTLAKKSMTELGVPCSRSLFKHINGFVKFADMSRKSRVDKTRWLAHEDLLLEITVEEGVLHIKLTNCPTKRENKSKHYFDA